MYFKINSSLLNAKTKSNLLAKYSHLGLKSKDTKKKIITTIISKYSKSSKFGESTAYAIICPYCRNEGILMVPKRLTAKPRFCMKCGKATPSHAFEVNLQRSAHLTDLASNKRKKDEQSSKQVLLEQALVTIITSFEILLRDVYSLILDYQHVVFGETIYPDVYTRSRNEFLNLGVATSKIKKVSALNIKKALPEDQYNFLSEMFSARHIIIHNCSIKDKEYLSQTGEPTTQLNQPLSLKLSNMKKVISIVRRVAKLLDSELRQSLLTYERKKWTLAHNIKHYYNKIENTPT